MIGFAVPAKAFFLDRPAMKQLLDDATIKPMNRIGGFIRLTARNSMRRKKYPNTAPAGQPPYAHVGLIKTKMAYSYDPRHGSLVAGPLAINRGSDAGDFTVPQLMEFGGSLRISEPRSFEVRKKKGGKAKRKKNSLKAKKTQRVNLPAGATVTYPPHPFMGPALAKAIAADKLQQAWKKIGA